MPLLPLAPMAPTAPALPASPSQPPAGAAAPRETIDRFLRAVADRDVATLRGLLASQIPNTRTDRFLKSGGFEATFSNLEVEKSTVEGELAIVEIKITWKTRNAGGESSERVVLRRIDNEWKLLAGDQFLGLVARVAGGDSAALEAFESSRARAREISCLSNGKQLALAVLMRTQDYDEVMPPKDWVPAVFPYFKNRSMLTCPLDTAGRVTYSFNAALAGKSLAIFQWPADTVAVYEGANGVLDFRHGGKAMVGFVDGHCKMIDAREARTLRWTPDGSRTPPTVQPKTGSAPKRRS